MDCVNHGGVNATVYCQNCGKGLCADCINAGAMRKMPGGQILCDHCIRAWQSMQPPFAASHPQGPNPSAAAVLGLIPGVGAMYNGQFIKGLIHVVIFAVLVSAAHLYGIFGLFVFSWVVYQSFEAYHTARARRDGLPLPDPLGLNEVGNWLNPTGAGRMRYPEQTGAGEAAANSGSYVPGSHAPSPAGQGTVGAAGGGYPPPYAGGQSQTIFQPRYQWAPYTPSAADSADPANSAIPPAPSVPPICWRRKEPIGAIVLIALGLLFLLGQLDLFSGRLFEFAWPLALIGLGVWLIVRRLRDSQGGPQ
jgi:TM2 domain-containing membrane protein YozV